MPQPDRAYFTVRAASSRSLSHRAASPAIAAIHADLATRYDMLATRSEQLAAGPASGAPTI